MAITNGQLTNADEVLQMNSLQYTNIAQMIYNSDYIGFNSALNAGTPNWLNLNYSVVDTTSDFSTTIGTPILCVNNYNVFYLSQGKLLYGGLVYDYMEGTSVTGANWVNVGTDALVLTQVDNAYVQGLASSAANTDEDNILSAALLDLYPESGTAGECFVKMYIDTNAVGSGLKTVTSYLYLRDENGNQVTLDTSTSTGNGAQRVTLHKIYRLVFTSDNVAVRDITSAYPGATIDLTIDTSSLVGTEWHLRARTFFDYTNGVASSTNAIHFYPIVYVKNTTISSAAAYETETTTITHTGNITEAYLTYNEPSGTLATSSFSCNNGSNYTNITKNDFEEIGTDGTQLKIKFDFSGTHTTIPILSEYACFYDCW